MVKKVVEDRLASYSKEDLEKAQKKLDRLSKKYKFDPPIRLNAGKSEWRELCYRMIGLLPKANNEAKKNDKGRPMERSDDENWEIGNDILCTFPKFDKNGKELKPLSIKKAINKVALDRGIKTKVYESGRQKDIYQVVRGIFYNKFPKLEAKRKKIQTKEDYEIDYPKEYYDNFYNNLKK